MRVLFPFIGEHHHVFHALPLAAALAKWRPDWQIETAVAGAEHLRCLHRVQQVYPDFKPAIHPLPVPAWLRPLQTLRWMDQQARAARLMAALPLFRRMDAIVTPERTSLLLRPALPRRTRLVFTPHGAGDRAIMVDWRDRHFDFVLVAGVKSEQRMLAARTIRPGHYAVNGYVKLGLMQKLRRALPPLFDNDRPVVLYAPHFRPALSSWPAQGRAVIEAFRAQRQYNLVVAPHIRLFHDASAAEKDAVLALAEPGRILIDLDSDRLVDMTYTAQADVYLGDVSSQVYEFLAVPRPCVFLNAHGVAWQGDPNYRFWNLGEVVDTAAQVPAAVTRSVEGHAAFAAAQRIALEESVGADPAGAAQRGAEALAHFLEMPAAQGAG